MHFASAYVYDNKAEDHLYEAVSDEEFMEGINISDSGSGSSDDEVEALAPAGQQERKGKSPQAPDKHPSCPSSVLETATGSQERTSSQEKPRRSMFGRMMGMFSSSFSDSPGDTRAQSGSLHAGNERRHRKARSKPSKVHHWQSAHSDPSQHAASSQSEGQKSKRRVFRRADTNIVSLRFDTLKTPSTMHAGDVIFCTRCEAILSQISSIENDGPDKVWKCEFCGTRNVVEIEEEEKPTADDVTFLLEPALSTSAMGSSGRDESIVVFCIDTSGSMTITTEVPGHMKLRGSAALRRLRRENTLEWDQRLPSEGRNVTYVSRLQAVQAAVDHQLGEMAKEFPHRCIGLVTFSSEVTVIGDGTGEVVTVSGEKLTKKDKLSRIGAGLAVPKAIKEVRASLGEKVFGLEEGGATALGPAIMIALSMASQRPGSKVILCTDGKSNEGVGKVENLVDTDPDPEVFYEEAAAAANDKGVSVSVITIKGTDCKLIQLGKLAASTGGQVNTVDPLKLTEEFSNVLADRIIATSVVATFILHKGLYIGREENESCKEKREIGNVNSDHEISFEFGVRRRVVQDKVKPSPLECISEVSTSLEDNPPSFVATSSSSPKDGEGESSEPQPTAAAASSSTDGAAGCAGGSKPSEAIPSQLPFQLQISYCDVDGTKALRVLTQKKPVTTDRNVAEKDIDYKVLGLHAERKSSELALEGDYTGSRAVALMSYRLGWRSSHSSQDGAKVRLNRQAFAGVRTVENSVSAKQQQEVRTYGRTHSDDETDELDTVAFGEVEMQADKNKKATAQSRHKKTHLRKMRSMEVDDDMARRLYQGRSSSSSVDQGRLSRKM